MKFTNYILVFLVLGLTINSCKKDDEVMATIIPERDRAEQYLIDIDSIETYLETHFYNYEEFQANPNTTDFEIVFDTIAGANSDKTPLKEQVDSIMMVSDGISDVEYKLYYLKVREGLGQQPKFADSAFVQYRGVLTDVDNTTFDSSANSVWFDLVAVVKGFQLVAAEFKGASSSTLNGDGTFTFEDFGIGAMFIPSGIGYFSQSQPGIPAYSPIIFTLSLHDANLSDHDADGIPSYLEDLDNSSDVFDDNTDGDLFPDFADTDDDDDGILTRDEVSFNEYVVDTNIGEMEPTLAANEFEIDRVDDAGVITIKTVVLTDADGDDTPDYLDTDPVE